MKVISTHLDLQNELYVRASAHREPGLHISEITKRVLIRDFSQYFKEYDDSEEETIRVKRIMEDGHIVEEAWGDALSTLIDRFDKPEARYIYEDGTAITRSEYMDLIDPPFGLWASPDGYVPYMNGDSCDWPEEYPELVTPCIMECKSSAKSCRPAKGHKGDYITHPKFYNWHWNCMAYLKGWGCHDLYLFVHHKMGDYSGHPPEPRLVVNHLRWTQAELDEHWDMLIKEAKEYA